MNRLILIGVVVGFLPEVAQPAADGICDISASSMDRGERRAFLICGENLAGPNLLEGLEPAGIEVMYQQNLRRCDVGDKRPGIYLVLKARPDAQSTELVIRNPSTGAVSCHPLPIDVPQRRLLPPATLEPLPERGPQSYRLSLTSDQPCESVSITTAPDSFVVLPNTADAIRCDGSSLTMPVRVLPGPQDPAKLILRGLGEAVAYVTAPPPPWLNAMRESEAQYVEIDGIRTRYFEKGHGEALLLVHGGQPSAADFNAWEWQQNFDGLAEAFHVYALDRVGQGYTDNPPDLADYADYYPLVVKHVYGFMQAMELDRVHLVGHSQGGWPVTRIALDHPDQVASLVIVDSTMVAPASNAAQAVRFYLYLSNDLHPPGGETAESIRRGLEYFSYTKHNITDQRVQRILALSRQPKYAAARDWFSASAMSPAHPSYRALKQQIWSELETGKLTAPTLIIWGSEDPEGSFDAGLGMFRRLATAGANVRFHAFAKSGHVPYMEYPEEFNAVVSAFCRGVD